MRHFTCPIPAPERTACENASPETMIEVADGNILPVDGFVTIE